MNIRDTIYRKALALGDDLMPCDIEAMLDEYNLSSDYRNRLRKDIYISCGFEL